MACKCAERRTSLRTGASAIARGNVAVAAKEAGFVVRTMAEDVAIVSRARLSALRATLARGIRR